MWGVACHCVVYHPLLKSSSGNCIFGMLLLRMGGIWMLSRRDLLKTAAAAGGAALVRPLPNAFAAASQPSTPVDFAVPAGACDCHTHMIGPPQRFPLSPSRVYTPEAVSIEEMQALHRALHTDRVVIVQPSIYGTDNSCTLDAIQHLGAGARGIAVIDDKTPESALDAMARAGIRGIRLNLATGGQNDPAVARKRFQDSVERIQHRKWHVQMYTQLSVIEAIKDAVMASAVPVVFDHFGGADAALGARQPGFSTLLNLVKAGKAYVKVSAPYRSSNKPPDYPDVAPLAKALIEANPQRILWGTDWPHVNSTPGPGHKITEITPLLQIDDGHILNLFARWAPDTAQQKMILVENPARLFGY
jgi:predicted TIM-barrel fold metal-dependent hydrolase